MVIQGPFLPALSGYYLYGEEPCRGSGLYHIHLVTLEHPAYR